MIVLIGSMFLILFILIVLVESVVLQLMRWGNNRIALRTALIMNAASAIFVFVLLSLAPRFGFWSIGTGFVSAIVIEGLILSRLNPELALFNWIVSVSANLASYLLLIVPVYIFRG